MCMHATHSTRHTHEARDKVLLTCKCTHRSSPILCMLLIFTCAQSSTLDCTYVHLYMQVLSDLTSSSIDVASCRVLLIGCGNSGTHTRSCTCGARTLRPTTRPHQRHVHSNQCVMFVQRSPHICIRYEKQAVNRAP